MKETVGVITPIFNGERFIQRCIDSVKNQSYQDLIHYLYDDGSTDNTKNLIKNCENYLSSSVNRGQSFARNVCLNIAIRDQCKYIAFLDVDDIWDNDHLKKSISNIDDFNICYSNPRCKLETGESVVPYGMEIPEEFNGDVLLKNNFIWISTVVLKNNSSLLYFNSELDSVEDWEMWLRLYNLGYRFKKLNQETVTYTVRADGQAGLGISKRSILKKMYPKMKL